MADRLRAWLDQHQLIGGGRLPSERTLAALLGCSRRQARVALQSLEQQGLVSQPTARTRTVAQANLGHCASLANTVVVLATPADLPATGAGRYLGLYQRVYLGLVDALERAGMTLLTMPADALMRDRVCQLLMRRPAGFLMLFDASRVTGGQALIDSARHVGVPVVVCGDHLHPDECARNGADSVGFDHQGGVAAVVDQVMADGHRRMLRLVGWNPAFRDCAWRLRQEAGWKQGLARHGLDPAPSVEVVMPDETALDNPDHHRPRILAGYLAEHVLGPRPPQALVAASDSLVPELGLACRLLGVHAELYGYDNLHDHPMLGPRMAATGFYPRASIDLDPETLARQALDLLLGRRSGTISGPPCERLSPLRLLVRSATPGG